MEMLSNMYINEDKNIVNLYLRANQIYKAFEKFTRGEITDETGVKFGIFH